MALTHPTPSTPKPRHHVRKAKPMAAASTVTVSPDGYDIVVVIPDVLGKNESHQSGRFLSRQTKNLRTSVRRAAWAWAERRCPGPTFALTANNVDTTTCLMPWTKAHRGAWRLEVIGVWPEQRHKIKGEACDVAACPNGDADAAIPQALDALQHAGILDDDARVVEVRAWNLYRKGERWTVIRLVRVSDLAERDAAIAHLVAALPPPATPAEPKPRTKAARRKRKETA